MAGWWGRPRPTDEADRLAALTARLDQVEAEQVATTARLREDNAASARRIDELAARLEEAEGRRDAAQDAAARLDRLERALDGVLPLLTDALVRRLATEAARGEPADIATALHRLDHQVKAHIADADRTARALVERVEQLHRRSG